MTVTSQVIDLPACLGMRDRQVVCCRILRDQMVLWLLGCWQNWMLGRWFRWDFDVEPSSSICSNKLSCLLLQSSTLWLKRFWLRKIIWAVMLKSMLLQQSRCTCQFGIYLWNKPAYKCVTFHFKNFNQLLITWQKAIRWLLVSCSTWYICVWCRTCA